MSKEENGRSISCTPHVWLGFSIVDTGRGTQIQLQRRQRSREQGELMPGDCAEPLKRGSTILTLTI
jgi:hypothetical protein